MEIRSFLQKKPFDDLKINTTDGKKLYMPKGWLYGESHHFRNLLAKDLSMTSMDLPYHSQVLDNLFMCMENFKYGSCFIEDYFLSKLPEVHVCDFFAACSEFQLTHIKIITDFYFNNPEVFDKLTDYKPAEQIPKLIAVCKQNDYPLMDNKLYVKIMIHKKRNLLDKINFEKVPCEYLDSFSTRADFFFKAVLKWAEKRKLSDLTDKDLSFLHTHNFLLTPKDLIQDMVRMVRSLENANIFRLKAYTELTSLLCPEPEQKTEPEPQHVHKSETGTSKQKNKRKNRSVTPERRKHVDLDRPLGTKETSRRSSRPHENKNYIDLDQPPVEKNVEYDLTKKTKKPKTETDDSPSNEVCKQIADFIASRVQ